MPTVYLQYNYTRHEAKPREYDDFETVTIPGSDNSFFKWGTVYDPRETPDPDAGRPGWEYLPNTGYDYYSRTIGQLTTVKPEGGSGHAAAFSELGDRAPNAWLQVFLTDDEFRAVEAALPPEQDALGPLPSDLPEWSLKDGRASIGWGQFEAGVSVGADLSTAFSYAAEYFASKYTGIGHLVKSFRKVESARQTLTDFMDSAVSVLDEGITNFETMDAGDFAKMSRGLFAETEEKFLAELETQLGTGSAASTILRSVNLVGGYLDGEFDLEVSHSRELDLSGGAGLLVVGYDVRTTLGSRERDVIVSLGDADPAPSPIPKTTELRGGDDVYVGSDIHEQVIAGSGSDEAFTYGGVDLFVGGGGADVAHTGRGADIAEGGQGRDRLFGERGSDVLNGNGGADALYGGGGDDVLEGGRGADALVGGWGRDTAEYGGSRSGVEVRLWAGTGAGGDAAGDTLRKVENVGGSDRGDLLQGDGEDNRLMGRAGADRLAGRDGDDTLFGEEGGDTLLGEAGRDRLFGGVGYDSLRGGAGADLLQGNEGGDHLRGEGGRDTLQGGRGEDLLEGGWGADRLVGSGGADRLFGGAGADDISGGGGPDRIRGGRGDDRIDGGGGGDRIWTGAGADTLVFGPWSGRDRVADFDPARDRIDLAAFDLADEALPAGALSDAPAGARLALGEAELILEGLAADALGDVFVF